MTVRTSRLLSELLILDIDQVEVVATDEYRIAGVYGFGRGLFQRGPIEGSDTSYKTLNRLHRGQLVVSRLKAFEGALAIVPDAFDGWFLSPEFPTFRCIEDELDPRYLANVCRWSEFWLMLATTSKGIGARRERVHAEDLLHLELTVPSIDEQGRVAARLDRLQAAAIELARQSDQASELMAALAVSTSARPDLDDKAKSRADWQRVALRELLQPSTKQVGVESTQRYRVAGIYSFGRGLIDRGEIAGTDTSYKTLTVLDEGDIVVSKLNGWEGAIGVVGSQFAGHCVSSEYPTFKANTDRLLPVFFGGIARSPWFWEALNSNTRGSMVRRRRISSTEFLATQIWLPPMDTQARVAESLLLIDRVMSAREVGRARVEALVPAAMNEVFAAIS